MTASRTSELDILKQIIASESGAAKELLKILEGYKVSGITVADEADPQNHILNARKLEALLKDTRESRIDLLTINKINSNIQLKATLLNNGKVIPQEKQSTLSNLAKLIFLEIQYNKLLIAAKESATLTTLIKSNPKKIKDAFEKQHPSKIEDFISKLTHSFHVGELITHFEERDAEKDPKKRIINAMKEIGLAEETSQAETIFNELSKTSGSEAKEKKPAAATAAATPQQPLFTRTHHAGDSKAAVPGKQPTQAQQPAPTSAKEKSAELKEKPSSLLQTLNVHLNLLKKTYEGKETVTATVKAFNDASAFLDELAKIDNITPDIYQDIAGIWEKREELKVPRTITIPNDEDEQALVMKAIDNFEAIARIVTTKIQNLKTQYDQSNPKPASPAAQQSSAAPKAETKSTNDSKTSAAPAAQPAAAATPPKPKPAAGDSKAAPASTAQAQPASPDIKQEAKVDSLATKKEQCIEKTHTVIKKLISILNKFPLDEHKSNDIYLDWDKESTWLEIRGLPGTTLAERNLLVTPLKLNSLIADLSKIKLPPETTDKARKDRDLVNLKIIFTRCHELYKEYSKNNTHFPNFESIAFGQNLLEKIHKLSKDLKVVLPKDLIASTDNVHVKTKFPTPENIALIDFSTYKEKKGANFTPIVEWLNKLNSELESQRDFFTLQEEALINKIQMFIHDLRSMTVTIGKETINPLDENIKNMEAALTTVTSTQKDKLDLLFGTTPAKKSGAPKASDSPRVESKSGSPVSSAQPGSAGPAAPKAAASPQENPKPEEAPKAAAASAAHAAAQAPAAAGPKPKTEQPGDSKASTPPKAAAEKKPQFAPEIQKIKKLQTLRDKALLADDKAEFSPPEQDSSKKISKSEYIKMTTDEIIKLNKEILQASPQSFSGDIESQIQSLIICNTTIQAFISARKINDKLANYIKEFFKDVEFIFKHAIKTENPTTATDRYDQICLIQHLTESVKTRLSAITEKKYQNVITEAYQSIEYINQEADVLKKAYIANLQASAAPKAENKGSSTPTPPAAQSAASPSVESKRSPASAASPASSAAAQPAAPTAPLQPAGGKPKAEAPKTAAASAAHAAAQAPAAAGPKPETKESSAPAAAQAATAASASAATQPAPRGDSKRHPVETKQEIHDISTIKLSLLEHKTSFLTSPHKDALEKDLKEMIALAKTALAEPTASVLLKLLAQAQIINERVSVNSSESYLGTLLLEEEKQAAKNIRNYFTVIEVAVRLNQLRESIRQVNTRTNSAENKPTTLIQDIDNLNRLIDSVHTYLENPSNLIAALLEEKSKLDKMTTKVNVTPTKPAAQPKPPASATPAGKPKASGVPQPPKSSSTRPEETKRRTSRALSEEDISFTLDEESQDGNRARSQARAAAAKTKLASTQTKQKPARPFVDYSLPPDEQGEWNEEKKHEIKKMGIIDIGRALPGLVTAITEESISPKAGSATLLEAPDGTTTNVTKKRAPEKQLYFFQFAYALKAQYEQIRKNIKNESIESYLREIDGIDENLRNVHGFGPELDKILEEVQQSFREYKRPPTTYRVPSDIKSRGTYSPLDITLLLDKLGKAEKSTKWFFKSSEPYLKLLQEINTTANSLIERAESDINHLSGLTPTLSQLAKYYVKIDNKFGKELDQSKREAEFDRYRRWTNHFQDTLSDRGINVSLEDSLEEAKTESKYTASSKSKAPETKTSKPDEMSLEKIKEWIAAERASKGCHLELDAKVTDDGSMKGVKSSLEVLQDIEKQARFLFAAKKDLGKSLKAFIGTDPEYSVKKRREFIERQEQLSLFQELKFYAEYYCNETMQPDKITQSMFDALTTIEVLYKAYEKSAEKYFIDHKDYAPYTPDETKKNWTAVTAAGLVPPSASLAAKSKYKPKETKKAASAAPVAHEAESKEKVDVNIDEELRILSEQCSGILAHHKKTLEEKEKLDEISGDFDELIDSYEAFINTAAKIFQKVEPEKQTEIQELNDDYIILLQKYTKKIYDAGKHMSDHEYQAATKEINTLLERLNSYTTQFKSIVAGTPSLDPDKIEPEMGADPELPELDEEKAVELPPAVEKLRVPNLAEKVEEIHKLIDRAYSTPVEIKESTLTYLKMKAADWKAARENVALRENLEQGIKEFNKLGKSIETHLERLKYLRDMLEAKKDNFLNETKYSEDDVETKGLLKKQLAAKQGKLLAEELPALNPENQKNLLGLLNGERKISNAIDHLNSQITNLEQAKRLYDQVTINQRSAIIHEVGAEDKKQVAFKTDEAQLLGTTLEGKREEFTLNTASYDAFNNSMKEIMKKVSHKVKTGELASIPEGSITSPDDTKLTEQRLTPQKEEAKLIFEEKTITLASVEDPRQKARDYNIISIGKHPLPTGEKVNGVISYQMNLDINRAATLGNAIMKTLSAAEISLFFKKQITDPAKSTRGALKAPTTPETYYENIFDKLTDFPVTQENLAAFLKRQSELGNIHTMKNPKDIAKKLFKAYQQHMRNPLAPEAPSDTLLKEAKSFHEKFAGITQIKLASGETSFSQPHLAGSNKELLFALKCFYEAMKEIKYSNTGLIPVEFDYQDSDTSKDIKPSKAAIKATKTWLLDNYYNVAELNKLKQPSRHQIVGMHLHYRSHGKKNDEVRVNERKLEEKNQTAHADEMRDKKRTRLDSVDSTVSTTPSRRDSSDSGSSVSADLSSSSEESKRGGAPTPTRSSGGEE